ncbi:hypothetical protein [Pollutimonas bauzanensis]|uniref:hypothetical protein n=1 Tax=Pollutimonas bauzanensis TaxID=658167 RepID=UPI0009329F25|nr:hypothetical protein [Pollutimonas bauzanensis]
MNPKFTYQKPSEQTVQRQTFLLLGFVWVATLVWLLSMAMLVVIFTTPMMEGLSKSMHISAFFTAVAHFIFGVCGVLVVIPGLRDKWGVEPLSVDDLDYLKHLADENDDVAEAVRKWLTQGLTLRKRDLDAINLYIQSSKAIDSAARTRQREADLLRELGSSTRPPKQQDGFMR